ncbi:MAG: hypothetical protein ACK52I_01520 [Pseudomonadota bacterium]|jgi:glucokinase
MKTHKDILRALRDRVGAEAVLAGDALAAVVEDLEALDRNERQWDRAMQQLERARDDGRIAAEDSLVPTGAM